MFAGTIGDPAGVGPLVWAKAARGRLPADVVLLGDRRALERWLPEPLPDWNPDRRRRLSLVDEPGFAGPKRPVPGRPDATHAPAVLKSLRRAGAMALAGQVDGVVTGPVAKDVLATHEPGFRGQTELLGQQARVEAPVMAMLSPRLRLVLATGHLPLAAVPKALTQARLEQVLRVSCHDLRCLLDLPKLRLRVCGLNPHAGENGLLGDEEIKVIKPVIARLRRARLPVDGPLPADTAFLPQNLGPADCVVAMYHDQALPVIKREDFAGAVNVTLGLPFIRASVGHGTAFAKARAGDADHAPLLAALTLAARMSRNLQSR
ncbi:MAG: 4-hydroxythreonine-4-phosphate dehydrogenase PdxA [Betaproteobacteria bacterium AqS2]|uniref:4-hydroxythreonine-4-phosphate dehydrogenase PdxA n=1 Tax=Candidatus Amphirhobacter heronislandensis TaxID=1732024 RepID=A0A930XWH9_9GAMM|nr:4-hydroxythreonine-4-phosphate dehydrogenase PdxA [Betaproteobacteria bacterium AqS2]